jgi:hypothetical protein
VTATFILLLLAFVAERAHQWQSLTSRDWSVRFQGREVPRSLVLWTALVIGWGEGLAFFITSEQTFWTFVFWVYVAHFVITGLELAWRGTASLVAVRVVLLILVTAAAAMIVFVDRPLPSLRPAAWFGRPLLDLSPSRTLAVFAIGLILAGHAIPCFQANLRRLPREARFRNAAVALGLALVEWLLVAKCVWFEEGSLFPDLVDWWDLGRDANFLLHPLWMAPFLAHVIIDAIRFATPPARAAA